MYARKAKYESDPEHFSADAYQEKGGPLVAWHILGWETEPDEDTEWTGQEVRTGNVVAYMAGDDTLFVCDENEFTPIKGDDYCGSCGQIGCGHG